MFKFTTTTIINTANAVNFNGEIYVDATGANVPKFAAKNNNTEFFVAGGGFFKKAGIQSVYKRPYSASVKEVATTTVTGVTSGDLLRFTITVKLVGKTLADYANVYQDFLKPISVDIVSSGTAANDATEIVKAVKYLTTGYDNAWFTISSSGAVITLTATSGYQRLSAKLEKIDETFSTDSQPKLTQLATSTVTTAGQIGFGDDAWMVQEVQIPTAQNTSYFRILRTERPIMGGNYTQFTLKYKVAAGEDDVWNADKKSITTHVFWVKSDLVTSFENALETVLGEQIPGGIALTAAGDATTLVNELTLQLTVSGAIGNVTYASSDETLATISTAGLVTAKAAPALGDVVLTATDSFGNVASITIEITA